MNPEMPPTAFLQITQGSLAGRVWLLTSVCAPPAGNSTEKFGECSGKKTNPTLLHKKTLKRKYFSRQLSFLRPVFREIENAMSAIPGIIGLGTNFEVLHSDAVSMI